MSESGDPIGERLERERPVPAAGFRAELRGRISDAGRGRASAPSPRIAALSYLAAGAACLVVSAVGLAGVGPFAS
jgi:hypothetical protein